MSCSTAQQFAPQVYLDHGAVLWYGNAGSGLCPQADLQDDWFFEDAMVYGRPVGPAFADTIWLHYRDFTTKDPTSMYGPSSLYGDDGITTVQCIYGDPLLVVYSPEWSEPMPVDSIYSGKENAPNTPSVSGPTTTETNEENEYSFLTTDPNNDNVYYYIDWGDGNIAEWIGPYSSGEVITSAHSWDETGTYTITVKAKDTTGLESSIATYTVEVNNGNNNQQFNVQVFLVQTVKNFLQQTIKLTSTTLFGN
jgi:hypothetical protein